MDPWVLRMYYKAMVSLVVVHPHFLSEAPNSLCSKLYLPTTPTSLSHVDSFYGDHRDWELKGGESEQQNGPAGRRNWYISFSWCASVSWSVVIKS